MRNSCRLLLTLSVSQSSSHSVSHANATKKKRVCACVCIRLEVCYEWTIDRTTNAKFSLWHFRTEFKSTVNRNYFMHWVFVLYCIVEGNTYILNGCSSFRTLSQMWRLVCASTGNAEAHTHKHTRTRTPTHTHINTSEPIDEVRT